MPGCFVANCDGGYRNCNEKLSLFRPPSNPELFEIWRRKIPRKDRLLKPSDRICERHFVAEDISRYFEINLGNGVVERIQRERALLKEGSIPLKYPNCPSYLSSAASKRKSPKTRTAKSPKQNKITNDSSSTETVSIVQNVNETSIVNFLPTVPNFDDSSLSTVRNIDNFPATVENLNKFIKIIDTRGLPLGWTYSVLPKGIAFLYWTENYHSVLRRFVIYSDGGDSKVFILEKNVLCNQFKKVIGYDDLVEVLEGIEEIKICQTQIRRRRYHH